jgi:hypothetical protein
MTELKQSIAQSKRKLWTDYLKNITGAEFGRAAQYEKPLAGTIVEALTPREGKLANTS